MNYTFCHLYGNQVKDAPLICWRLKGSPKGSFLRKFLIIYYLLPLFRPILASWHRKLTQTEIGGQRPQHCVVFSTLVHKRISRTPCRNSWHLAQAGSSHEMILLLNCFCELKAEELSHPWKKMSELYPYARHLNFWSGPNFKHWS